jgi:hypothetical protein
MEMVWYDVSCLTHHPNTNQEMVGRKEILFTLAMRVIYSSIKEDKSRLLMSCTLAQEMLVITETVYLESAADHALLLYVEPVLWLQVSTWADGHGIYVRSSPT